VLTSGPCSSANSAIATVTVGPISVGGTVAGSATVCTGTNSTTLTLSGFTGAITRWESSPSSTFASAVTSIANTTTTLTATDLTATTYYRAVITNSPCGPVNSAIATVTVSPASVGGTVAGSATVCSGTNSTTLTLSGHTGSVTKWQSSTSSTFASSVTDISNTTTTLTQDLLIDDDWIYVRDVNVLSQPDPVHSSPGVIFINGERITFYIVDIVNKRLGQLRRSTNGTGGASVHAVGTHVYDAGFQVEIPDARDSYTSVTNETILIGKKGDEVTIPAGSLIRQGQLWYDISDSSATNGLGLENSTSIQVNFLKAV
jgi:hypothetical protein